MRHFIAQTLIIFIINFSTAYADDDNHQEYHIKAAFLYNLSLMIKWPDERAETPINDPLLICTLAQDPFGILLDAIEENTVRKRNLILKRNLRLEQIEGCHVLFIPQTQKDNLKKILSYVRDSPILTVSEIDRFAHQGGMINMVKRRNRVKLEINLEILKKAQFYANARLLVLAKIVN